MQWIVQNSDSVLKQQTQGQVPMAPSPLTMMQMQNSLQNNWSNIQSTASGSGSLPRTAVNNNLAGQIEAINTQQIALQEQIRQSEQNLTAQHNVPKTFSVLFQIYSLMLLILQSGAYATAEESNR